MCPHHQVQFYINSLTSSQPCSATTSLHGVVPSEKGQASSSASLTARALQYALALILTHKKIYKILIFLVAGEYLGRVIFPLIVHSFTPFLSTQSGHLENMAIAKRTRRAFLCDFHEPVTWGEKEVYWNCQII